MNLKTPRVPATTEEKASVADAVSAPWLAGHVEERALGYAITVEKVEVSCDSALAMFACDIPPSNLARFPANRAFCVGLR